MYLWQYESFFNVIQHILHVLSLPLTCCSMISLISSYFINFMSIRIAGYSFKNIRPAPSFPGQWRLLLWRSVEGSRRWWVRVQRNFHDTRCPGVTTAGLVESSANLATGWLVVPWASSSLGVLCGKLDPDPTCFQQIPQRTQCCLGNTMAFVCAILLSQQCLHEALQVSTWLAWSHCIHSPIPWWCFGFLPHALWLRHGQWSLSFIAETFSCSGSL